MKKITPILCLMSILSVGVLGYAASGQLAPAITDGVTAISPLAVDEPVLDLAEFGNGTFARVSKSGNDIGFEYNYAKKNPSGFITLGKNRVGNPTGKKFYVGNTTPITSLNSITVTLGADGGAIAVYASSDGENYAKVDYLKEGHLTTEAANKYLYFRLVNGNQDSAPVSINSMTLSYDCNPEEFTPEAVDISGYKILHGSAFASKDTETKRDGSTSSLRVTNTTSASMNDVVISLGRTLTKEELLRANLSMYVDGTHNAGGHDDSNNTKTYFRIQAYPAIAGTRNSGKAYWQSSNLAVNSSWNKVTFDFSASPTSSSLAAGEDSYDSIFLRCIYIENESYINIDDMQLSLSNDYPAIPQSMIDTYEANDLINNPIKICYGTTTASNLPGETSIDSVLATKVNLEGDWKMWYYQDASNSFSTDMTGKVITFDASYADRTRTDRTPTVAVRMEKEIDETMKCRNVNVALGSSTQPAGVTYTDLGDNWGRYVVDVDVAWAAITADPAVPGNNHGFSGGYVRTIYMDNLSFQTK